MKRKRGDDIDATPRSTPRKARSSPPPDASDDEIQEAVTPSRRTRGKQSLARDVLAKSNAVTNGTGPAAATPKSAKRVLFATPRKASEEQDGPNGTPTIVRNADRSARRKSARQLMERQFETENSDEDVLDDEDILAAEILGEEEDEEDEEDGSPTPDTPSKRGRGRPKGQRKKKERSPTPPTDLPPHELYFWQNRPGANKTSTNTLSGHKFLDHEEYFHAMKGYIDPHEPEKEFLLELHARAFDQWVFELEEGFSICLYGYGSKTTLVEYFASYLHTRLTSTSKSKTSPKILIVNGFNPTLTLREILTSIATTFLPSTTQKLPTQPAALLSHILTTLTTNPPPKPHHILLNTIDSPSLRRQSVPSSLAALAACPHISLLATADTPTFPLLWDSALRAQYRFLFHDATTFQAYTTETSVVDDVNTLLGRSGRRVQGKDGVSWVLRSLPQNARALFLILVAEQLAVMIENGDEGGEEELEPVGQPIVTPQKRNKLRHGIRSADEGVEYRVLYHKDVEAFICTSEVAFRTLLKEFHDHQMVESRKDGLGTERLVVPFRRDELESLVEELAAEE